MYLRVLTHNIALALLWVFYRATLCLVYNLTLAKPQAAVGAPKIGDQISNLSKVLDDWSTDVAKPQKLAITLKHQYTQGGLSWDALKGVDRPQALALAAAARRSGCHAYLGLLKLWESGSLPYDDYEYDRRSSQSHRKSDEHVFEELLDSSLPVEHLQSATGDLLPLKALNFEVEEILPKGSLRSVTPEEDVDGYTGNEGLTLDRWYRHAAVVLWPDSHHFNVLCDKDSRNAVPLLNQMTAAIAELKGDGQSPRRNACKTFAQIILDRWPEQSQRPWYAKPSSAADTNDPTSALVTLGDIKLVRQFLRNTLLLDVSLQPSRALAEAISQHGWLVLQPDLVAFFKDTSHDSIERNAMLLKQLCEAAAEIHDKKVKSDAMVTAYQLAELSIDALSRIDENPSHTGFDRSPADRVSIVANMTRGMLAARSEKSLTRLVEHVVKTRKRYDLHTSQIPAIFKVRESAPHAAADSPALAEWMKTCIDQLRVLTAAEPKPPEDFRRTTLVRCDDDDCKELNQFLTDPNESVHQFQMAERRRSHLADAIKHAKCDLTLRTDKRPRHQILICTKNTASFERSVETYRDDLKVLAQLESFQTGRPRA